MADDYYTHAVWTVRAGAEAEFERIWREELGPAFLQVAEKANGTLLKKLDEPRVYVSFGAWPSLEEMQNGRADPKARQALEKLKALCEEATPGAFERVLSLP